MLDLREGKVGGSKPPYGMDNQEVKTVKIRFLT
jgi:hypothetical protein